MVKCHAKDRRVQSRRAQRRKTSVDEYKMRFQDQKVNNRRKEDRQMR
jgi:hypothetical protein